MSKKSNVIILLVLSVILFVGSTFAWIVMTKSNTIGTIIINAGKIKVDCDFYLGKDTNKDGIIDQESGKEVYILQNELNFTDVLPGDVYSFRVTTTNNSDYALLSYYIQFDKNTILKDYKDNVSVLSNILINYDKYGVEYSTLNEFLMVDNGCFFQNKDILFNETQDFYFKIKISENLGNNLNDFEFRIKNIIVGFEQKS